MDLTLLTSVSFRGQEVTSPRIRELLALLADSPRSGSSTALLAEGLWPDKLPENPTKAVQILVSRARASLGAETIVSTPAGYRLGLDETRVDSSAVLIAVADVAKAARDTDHLRVVELAEPALALWGGIPASGGDDAYDALSVLREQRVATYRRLEKARALALSGLGRHEQAHAELSALFERHPQDEDILAALLESRAATQGPSKALAAYDAYRRELRAELGTEPGAALKEVYRRLLQNEAPPVRQGVVHDPNPLLGRDGDVTAAVELLRTSRVVSLVGPGGLGKTRLAHVIARRTDHRLIYFVPLAGVTADADVADEVASAIGAHGAGAAAGPSGAAAGIAEALKAGKALLILDNCEQVTRGTAELVRDLISRTKDLSVLTTTRTPLGLSSESLYQVPELSLPVTIKLFEQRARAARPDADLPRDVVTALCERLDGLPLAVELAAARIRVMAVTDIARRLEDRFSLLRGGARDSPERHRTLQAVVDWSWNLLSADDQAAMRTLAVFPAGFAADAAQRVCRDDDLIDVLEHLVDQSLLKIVDQRSGVRFRMLETVREFSGARREEAGGTDAAVTGFLAWAREFGLAHHDALCGPDPQPSLDLIRLEQDNLLLALRQALARDDGDTAAVVTAVLAATWIMESEIGRVATLIEETSWFLSHYRPGAEFTDVVRTATTFSGMFSFFADPEHALRHLATIRRLPAAPPDNLPRALAVVFQTMAETRGGFPEALFELCESDEVLLAGVANGVASYLYGIQGEPELALAAAQRKTEDVEALSSPWYRRNVDSRIAELHLEAGHGAEALYHLKRVLETVGERAQWSELVGIRWGMVMANLQVGDVDEAERWLDLATVGPNDETRGEATFGLGVRAEIELARGRVDEGLELWRRTVGRLGRDGSQFFRLEPVPDPSASEILAVAVVAHARHGRVEQVAEIVGKLPTYLDVLLASRGGVAPSSPASIPVFGVLLLALGMADVNDPGADPARRASGVRMIALAERCRFPRGFQPTLRPETVADDARNADGPAYSEAISEYAGLGREELRDRAVALLAVRPS